MFTIGGVLYIHIIIHVARTFPIGLPSRQTYIKTPGVTLAAERMRITNYNIRSQVDKTRQY